jgi:hypothetical protein
MKPFALWTAFSQTKHEDAAQKKRALNAILISLLVHIAFIILAVSLTILIIAPKPKMMFEGKKSPSLPARKLEHAIRVKQMQKQTRKPQILQRLVTEAPSKVALPEMPDMKTPDIKNMRDTPLMNSRAGSIGGLGGGGGGAGRGLTGGMGYSDTKFFGENVRTRAMVICFDISTSMIEKGVIQDVITESAGMLDKMNVSTKFNYIVFVDGEDSFAPQMVYATQENKAFALAWLDKVKNAFDPATQRIRDKSVDGQLERRTGSTSLLALQKAVELGAETIFLLTDEAPWLDDGTATPGDARSAKADPTHIQKVEDFVRSIEKTTGRQVKIYPILYDPKPKGGQNQFGIPSVDFHKTIARVTGGKVRVISKNK